MSFWRFLRFERPYLILFASGFLMTVSVLVAEGDTSWRLDSLGYVAALNLLLAGGFLGYRYWKNIHAIRSMGADDTEPLSLEAAAYCEALEAKEKEHLRALNEAQAKRDEYHDFIVSWFHEIKTPISVIRLMQQTEVDPAGLEEEVSRIEHYVDMALYYAKLDSFGQDYEIVRCDLEQIVKSAVKSHSKAFISRRIRLSLDLHPYTVQSDPKWLHFILNQLLSNSLKYTEPRGEIRIGIRSEDGEKMIVVRDTGIGIEPKDLPRIWNRGFSGANGRLHMKSTGMGLYLAQELAIKLGHRLTCTSEPGVGTEMVIRFPRHADPHYELLQDQTASSGRSVP